MVNKAFGPVMDEDAFLVAFDENLVHTADIDVYKNEPADEIQAVPVTHPRIIRTGHYARYSINSAVVRQKKAVENLTASYEGGEKSNQCLNPIIL
jgi:phosphoglycerate dehydrogenase-like enzyme